MKALFYPLLFLVLFSSVTVKAQQPAAKESTAPPALTRQYYGLKEKANSYREGNQDYKVVSVNSLEAFWKSVQQAIKATEQGLINDKKKAEQELAQSQKTIAEQQKQIEALKLQKAEIEQQVQQNLHDVNNLSVLGIDMPKQFYVAFSAIIIIALVISLTIAVFRYKGSKRIAVEKQNGYNDIEQELNEHKKKARERELKVKRDLQTEMNLREELSIELERLKKHVIHKD